MQHTQTVFLLRLPADMELHNNQFKGTLPSSFQYLTSLRRLTLDFNKFSGSLPDQWGKMTDLEALGLVRCIICSFSTAYIFGHKLTQNPFSAAPQRSQRKHSYLFWCHDELGPRLLESQLPAARTTNRTGGVDKDEGSLFGTQRIPWTYPNRVFKIDQAW